MKEPIFTLLVFPSSNDLRDKSNLGRIKGGISKLLGIRKGKRSAKEKRFKKKINKNR